MHSKLKQNLNTTVSCELREIMLHSDTFIDTGMALKWFSTKDLCILSKVNCYFYMTQQINSK